MRGRAVFPLKLGLPRRGENYAYAAASLVLVVGITTALFAAFQLILLPLFSHFLFVGIAPLLLFEVAAVTAYTTALFLSLHSRICRMVSLAACFTIAASVLGSTVWIAGLGGVKVALAALEVLSVIGFALAIKGGGPLLQEVHKKAFVILGLLASSSLVASATLAFPVSSVRIEPKTTPELYFWTGWDKIPQDNETLDMCREGGIGFTVTVWNQTVGRSHYLAAVRRALSRGVNLYFCIGGREDFFASVDNAAEFPDAYRNLRDWFREEGIWDSPHLKGFVLDAETPKRYAEPLSEMEPVEAINYLMENRPSEEELGAAERAMVNFTESIRADGKEAGITRIYKWMDEADGDADLAEMTRNLYSPRVRWDFSVAMVYRTADAYELTENPGGASELSGGIGGAFYGMVEDRGYPKTSLYSSYATVGLQQTPSELDVPVDRQYIIIGTFYNRFENTTFIEEEEYLLDLDICRHFGEGQVHLFELSGFLYHYGWEGVERLVEYNRGRAGWMLDYEPEEAMGVAGMYLSVAALDAMI